VNEPQVTVTARYLLDHDLWIRACEMTGLNEWAVNEGRMDASDTVTLTIAQAAEIGLLDSLRRQAEARSVIVRAVQTCGACPAQWDAWGNDGTQYYLRYRHSFGSAEIRRTADGEWLDSSPERVAEFETDEQDGGVISLEEFCERAGLELRLS
jgi:hypothetical protein